MKTKPKRRPYGFTIEVDIDEDQLYEAGWHHESECEWADEPYEEPDPEPVTFPAAVASLHRQAHPRSASIITCHEEPCRWLTLDQLHQIPA